MSTSTPSEASSFEDFFADLERQLATLSHTDEAVQVVEAAVAGRFRKTAQRQLAFAQPGTICIEPVVHADALAAGAIGADDDEFALLQGDIVSTQSAWLMGERIGGNALFAVLNATCDLVPGRREYASLLRVLPLTGDAETLKSTLHHLLSFRSRRDLYLPPLPNEKPPTLGYAIRFDGIAQIRVEELLLSRRLGSLSLVGCRIFGSFARVLISRAGEGEAVLRSKLGQRGLQAGG